MEFGIIKRRTVPENPNIPDEELVAASLGDKQAFRGVVERYEKPLRRYVSRLAYPEDLGVDDVLQETFVKAYLHLNDYDRNLKFSSWIYRIAHNEAVNFLRKAKGKAHVVATGDELRAMENVADENDYFAEIHGQFGAARLHEALALIPRKHREPLLLRFFEGKDYAEISDILQIPEGTVATYLRRGKKELKSLLAHRT